MTEVDLGCGVGEPLIEIARFSGARIIGVNNNALQLQRAARRRSKSSGRRARIQLHADKRC